MKSCPYALGLFYLKRMGEKMMKKLFQVKMTSRTMVYMAMFMALTTLLSWINSFFPEMKQGGTISIDIIAIFVCAYSMGAGYGVICGIGTAILQFALGLAQFWGPWSVLLDYVLPLAVCGLAPLVKTTKMKGISIYWGLVLSMFLKFLCHFASGVFLFGSSAPAGMSPMIYSLLYNAPYNIATLVVCMIVMSLIYPRLEKVGQRF